MSDHEKKFTGKLVGPGGAGLKEIEAKSGASVRVDDITVTFDGTDEQVAKASAMVKEILKGEEDYCGPEGNRLRAEAQAHYKKQHELKDQADAAFTANNKDEGHKLMAQSKEEHQKAEETDKKACATIIAHRNDGKGEFYLDLHGLQVKEAMGALEDKMNQLKGKHGEFEVIPGAGKHSAAGGPKIKPEVEKYLKSKNLPYKDKNEGTFLVTL